MVRISRFVDSPKTTLPLPMTLPMRQRALRDVTCARACLSVDHNAPNLFDGGVMLSFIINMY